MAAHDSTLFLEKVSRLLSRQNGKPVLKPNKTLALRDTVANRKPKKQEASCVTEISLLMVCWKQNNFVDGLCSNELKSFYTCVQQAQVARKNKSKQTSPGGLLSPKQATTLLRRFPNQRTEI